MTQESTKQSERAIGSESATKAERQPHKLSAPCGKSEAKVGESTIKDERRQPCRSRVP
jgi:hypothetical protein